MGKLKYVFEEDLAELQKLALPAVEWLFDNYTDEYRTTGRTRLLAVAFLKLAYKYPKKKIYCKDHFPNVGGFNNVMREIGDLISKYNMDINMDLRDSVIWKKEAI